MPFRIHWSAEQEVSLSGILSIRDSGDGQRIGVGDVLYIISDGQQSKLLARLSVLNVTQDTFRSRIDLRVGGPKTAVFFTRARDAVPVSLQSDSASSLHREATLLRSDAVHVLTTACGAHDFSRHPTQVHWAAIVRQVKLAVTRARRYRDPRPDVEIAESFLRRKFVTSQLPGPAPVYQNAARHALGHITPQRFSVPRRRHELTREKVQLGISEDVATGGQTPNTSRHQEILERLRVQLEQIGFAPRYDGLVDCIVEATDADIYFEVKSTSPESVVHQVRTGLGQVLHYMWMDSNATPRKIRGHLVVEGPWANQNESLRDFLGSCLIRLTWSQDIPSMDIRDLEVLPACDGEQSSHSVT